MKKLAILIGVFISVVQGIHAQLYYQADILGNGFQMATIQQPDDYEGKVTCTLVRKPATTNSTKAVLYIHGFNDYFFQEEMANQYTSQGFNFYALDLRKYGRSWLPNQKMNNVRDLKEYFADIDTALQIIKQEGAVYTLLSGHSTGGLIVTYYAQQHYGSKLLQGLFLNSPFFDFNLPQPTKKTGIPKIAKQGVREPDLLRKPGTSTLYGESLHQSGKGEWNYNLTWKPFIAPAPNYGWINAIYTAQKKVKKGGKISQPILLMYSDNSVYTQTWTDQMFKGDAVLDVKDIAERGAKLKGNKTIVVIKNGMHDLVLSPKPVRDTVYKQLFTWLVKQ
ncbi:alpha/beta hydrolase [Flavihumibacter profundi]|uniref:alpha/beta hydrolase n=1 Tax=Flavihumibacter profundi TaxID=2716883 RepID=UPI001CC622C6|nr:alpha/beta hydrolase [Flavihumibacter profundi]MBZ5856992.1 alpha/beta hydrolase [Flavihumibacter profundi]